MSEHKRLSLFETKTTTLTYGVSILKVDARDNAQLDLLTTLLEKKLSEGWRIDGISVPGVGLMVYTLIREPTLNEDEPWQ